ncbi:unnamed protein product [Rotaria magnacalcarata]|uniref:Actin-related protein 3 n=2 Tax=Rotaria magnacalcarata TaxID=392030 RepID=A0A8S2PNF0_9BILA|nr:unnamed protein product [Rotaria magnacalcarata]
MIPSSKIAFQVISAVIAVISLVAFGMTGYLFAFHIYLCYNHTTTYDFVVSRRHDRTVDQTLLQFNQINRNKNSELTDTTRQSSTFSKFFPLKRKNNRIANSKDQESNQTANGKIFTVEENSDTPRRIQMSQNQLLLFDAIEKGHTSIVLKLLRNQFNINVKDIHGRTPLMIAAKNGRSDIVKILLDYIGAANIETDIGGKTALHYAAENSELSVVKILSKHQSASMAMTTTQTQLLPLDYALGNQNIYASLNKYSQGGQVSAGETDDDAPKAGYSVKYPIRHGIVEDWDLMEKYWEHCLFKYLRCDPEDHHFLLTEPPLNTPENREYTAEIMFELFNVPGLYIALQATLALYASWIASDVKNMLTGLVVDSGDGVTHVVPVADGYLIGSSIKHVPISGRDITYFVQTLLREREPNIPPEQSLETAKTIKERYCYVCPDIAKEFAKFDEDPRKNYLQYTGINSVTKKPFNVDIGHERFLGPEIFFHPEFANPEFNTSLSKLIDDIIQDCPVDVRRKLYGNIVLSGGSTMFKGFDKRLKRDVQRVVDARLRESEEISKHKPEPIDVKVVAHAMQRYAVWFGGSLAASTVRRIF